MDKLQLLHYNLNLQDLKVKAHRKSKVLVIIRKNGAIYAEDCSRGTLYELFSGQKLLENELDENDTVYFFQNSLQISKHLRAGKCLDEFINNNGPIYSSYMIWSKNYKYIGCLYNDFDKRRLLLNGDTVKVVDSSGSQTSSNTDSPAFVNSYSGFVGTNDEYEFFKWLNS